MMINDNVVSVTSKGASTSEDRDVAENRENWDDRAEVHFHSGGYGDLDALVDDPQALTSVVRRDLQVIKPFLPNGSVKDQRLLHLQCHIGTDTLCWVRLGAKDVCGLDFSPASLRHARELANRANVDIHYVEADARKAAQALPGRQFDVIVTSVGTVTWLPKLDQWAYSIARLLAPGGIFMIRDTHPLLFALDDSGLKLGGDYFAGAEDSWESDQTYKFNEHAEDGACSETGDGVTDASLEPAGAARKPVITHTSNHNWAHDFAEMTQVLIDAGLVVEKLGEYAQSDWKCLSMLEQDPVSEAWLMPDGYPRIPLSFSIVARKPCEN
jgi:SAM-dependent methyltransferase